MVFSQKKLSRICEVLTMNGDIIATGRISEITDKGVKITNSVGVMALLDGNMMVKLLVHNNESDDEVFVALVYSSSPTELHLSNIELLANLEKREYFRVSVKINTKCYIDDGSGELDEIKSFKVKVRDLSLRGSLIVTNASLEENQSLYIVLPLSRPEIFKCTVKRRIKYLRSEGYGCEFGEYTSMQEDLLCQYIFEEQRKMILKAKSFE